MKGCMINADILLEKLEKIRIRKEASKELPDYTIRLCEAEVAEMAGYENRMDWQHCQIKS